MNIRFEHIQHISPNPQPGFPDVVFGEHTIYIHWDTPQDNFCYYTLHKDNIFIALPSKTATSLLLGGPSGGFRSKEDFLAYVERYLENSYYGAIFRIEANRSCLGLGLPPIYDEVTVTKEEPTSIEPIKQLPVDKITSVGEPINIANGEMFTTEVDILLSGKGIPLGLSRKYQSQSEYNGPFGYGWRTPYDIRLTEDTDGNVIEVDQDGVHTIYTLESDGYTTSVGKYGSLIKKNDGTYIITRKHGVIHYFDAEGKLVEIVDRNNNYTTVAYAADGVISYVMDAGGRELRFISNAQGRIIEVEDPLGRVFHYEYSADGNLSKVIDPLGNETFYHYDNQHNLIQKIDANGHSLYFEYDDNDYAYRSWQDDNNNEVNLTFDFNSNITVSTDSRGSSTTYEFDGYGLVSKITDNLGGVQKFVWDDNFNKISATDQNGHTSTFTYDEYGNILSAKDSLGNTTIFSYTLDFHFLKTRTDTLGKHRKYFYDQAGNLVQSVDPLGNSAHYVYDLAGQLIQTKDANNNVTYFIYDSYGNLIKVKDAQTNETQFEYDILGNLKKRIDAQGNSTIFNYDALNRLVQTIYPDSSTAYVAYDAVGNVLSATDPNGNTTTYAYDEADWRAQITDALNNSTAFTYDTEGNRLSITDAKGNVARYEYDSLSRLITTADQQSNQAHFTYDAAGNLISKTDAKSNTITYTYDALNRLIKKQYPDETQEQFGYDSEGRILIAANPHISYTFAYDALGRILETRDSAGRSLSYRYDSLGNRISMIALGGENIAYDYDSLSRLLNVTDSESNITTYSYDSLGRRLQTVLANGSRASYEYDSVGNLLSVSNSTSSNKTISSYHYEYDNFRNRINKIQPGLKTVYVYDSLYRLTQSLPSKVKIDGKNELKVKTAKTKSEEYTYDSLGNRLTSRKDTYLYNRLNQLLSSDKYIYAYDQNGNCIKKIETEKDDGSQSITAYTYDYENRLTRIIIEEGGKETIKIITYAYDPFGRRIKKIVKNQEEDVIQQSYITTYVYDNENIVFELKQKRESTKQEITSYTHGPGIDEPLSISRDNKTYFYHYDGLGSVTALTDQKQKVVEFYSYDSFGNFKKKGSKAKNRYRFTAREFDKESGLYYYRNRYYDPKIGRFLTEDPIGFLGGVNFYGYAGNNPVNYVDPWGLCGEKTKAKPYWPKWAEILIPGYGYYGGPIRTDLTFVTKPSDSMDALFREHDIAWLTKPRKEADRKLIRGLYTLPKNPSEWKKPAEIPWMASFYRRIIVEPFFWWASKIEK